MAIHCATPGVHHLALRSANLERSRAFYGDVLGFPIVLEADNIFLFLAGGTAIAIRGPEAGTPRGDRFDPFRVGLDHVALGCEDAAELTRVARALAAASIDNTGVKLDPTLNRQYVAFKDPDRIAWELYMAPNDAVSAVDAYLAGLSRKDLSAVPFAPDVTFESPLSPAITGAASVRALLEGMFPAIKGVRVLQHITQGEHVATRFDLDTTFGVIPVFDNFHVVGGQLKGIRPFYDPRPLLAPVSATA
jgi:catechol 2,3-dioxygenase-like lactoylglutathione lyase family enzyme